MSDLLDYLEWRGDLTFETVPFSAVDMLVLSQISYINFSGFVSPEFNKPRSLSDICEDFFHSADLLERSNLGAMINPKTIDLFLECGKSKRFGSLLMRGYQDVYDRENAVQFAAITFTNRKNNYTVYRGTDDTIAGWKEDFNLGYMKEIPSQKLAVEYFEKAAASVSGKFYLAGHSKGGNLAMYAGMKSGKFLKRIETIYNFDGPGFWNEVIKSDEFKKIESKILSFYPEFSVVGMMFMHPSRFQIVQSTEFAIMQHDPLSWEIKNLKLANAPDFKEESKFFYATFNNWAADLEKEKIKEFVDSLFDIIYSTGAETNTDLEERKIQSTTKIVHAMAKLESAKRDGMMEIVQMFLKVAKGNIPMFNLFQQSKHK